MTDTAAIPHRRLGASDLRIAPLVLGGNVFGWTADRATSFAVLDAFVDGDFGAAAPTGGWASCGRSINESRTASRTGRRRSRACASSAPRWEARIR